MKDLARSGTTLAGASRMESENQRDRNAFPIADAKFTIKMICAKSSTNPDTNQPKTAA
jgi:hypothetical protein